MFRVLNAAEFRGTSCFFLKPSGQIPDSFRPSAFIFRRNGVLGEVLLDPEELIVFCGPFGTGDASGFDEVGLNCHGEVRDECIGRFTASVTDDRAQTVLFCEPDRLKRFRERADLVRFNEEGVGCFLLNAGF